MSLVRQMRGGRDYDPQWGARMVGHGAFAELIGKRFAVATAKLGLNRERRPLRTDLFAPPRRPQAQMDLFGA